MCLVGASGCGKSTLLNLVAGLDAADRGHGRSRAGEPSLMFQEAALFPWLSVERNVELPLRLTGVPEGERRDRVGRAARDGPARRRSPKRQPHELSGGMRQRVALARALAQDAEVLLMDEPFGALDAMTRDILHDELERIWQETGRTVLFVTHNVREAVRLGDRIVLLTSRPGRVAEEFPVDIAAPATDRGRRRRGPRRRASPTRLREEVRPPWPVAAEHACPRDSGRRSEVAGLDALETPLVRPRVALAPRAGPRRGRRSLAIGIAFVVWQLVVLSGWKPDYVLPGPIDRPRPAGRGAPDAPSCGPRSRSRCVAALWGFARRDRHRRRRSARSCRRFAVLRAGIGSLITGLQTMPSIAWFPLAILLFKLTEEAIMFVVVLGAAPSIANGLIHGIDHIPPVLLRAGRVLGARGHRGVPPRDPAGGDAVVRRRAQAGLGVRLAEPDGRRAAGDHRRPAVARPAAPGQPGAVRRARACWR